MRYRLLALDLDGTLIGGEGKITPASCRAIAAAQAAGITVVPCTGRGWREAVNILEPVADLDLGVFVTGAVIAEIATGKSLDFAVIEPHLALELVTFLSDEPEVVVIYHEAGITGYDYSVTGKGTLNAQTENWFKKTGATVRFQSNVTLTDLHHTLRVGLVALAERMPTVLARLREQFGDRVLLHEFRAITHPDPLKSVHLLEIFGQGVDKWRGLSWIAQQRGIAPEQIAAIGDQTNDLSMLKAAGCGIAMGNASDAIKHCADRVTETNREDGVARAIDRLLDGTW